MKRFILLLLIFVNYLILSSCYDYVEVNSIYYAASLGLDYDESSQMFKVYIYILNNLNLSQMDIATSEGDKMAYVATATDSSLTKAFNTIYQNSDVLIDLHHLKTVILTENFFNEDNCLRFYQLIKNNHDFYLNFAIYTTKDQLTDIYVVQNFTETSAYYTLLTKSNNYNNYYLPSFIDFANDVIIDNFTIIYPLLKVSYVTFQKDDQNYITLSLNGYTLIDNDYKLALYQENEFYGINYLNNLTNFKIPIIYNDQKYIFDIQRFKRKSKLRNDTFTISFYLRGSIILDDTMAYNLDFCRRLLENEISYGINQIYDDATSKGLDFFNINELARLKGSNNTFQTVKFEIDFEIVFI